MPSPRPTIRVHSANQARAAAAAAIELGQPIRLLSPPLAGASYGPDVFREIIALARADHPSADILAVLDCGDRPCIALSAFRLGIPAVRVDVEATMRDKLADIAAQSSAALDTADGPVLDLETAGEPLQACRAFLGSQQGR